MGPVGDFLEPYLEDGLTGVVSRLGSPLFMSHEKAIWKRNNPSLRNHLLTGMILQVDPNTYRTTINPKDLRTNLGLILPANCHQLGCSVVVKFEICCLALGLSKIQTNRP